MEKHQKTIPIALILLIILVAACQQNAEPFESVLTFENLDSAKAVKLNPESEFADYVFNPKDTIRIRKNKFGHYNEIIALGQCTIDSSIFDVKAILKNISFIDHYKTRSTLSLISEEYDTLHFEAYNPEELPIDIYQNHFVFLNADSTYAFSKASLYKNELICFVNERPCFVRW